MRVLILGADGFIGRHIAFHLRDQGHEVLAQARHPERMARMGFATLKADLTDPATHDPIFWRPHLEGTHLINAAGLLTGSGSPIPRRPSIRPKGRPLRDGARLPRPPDLGHRDRG